MEETIRFFIQDQVALLQRFPALLDGAFQTKNIHLRMIERSFFEKIGKIL